ncbi:hypothetical protein GLYMA_10G293300v4 [Glycine max]|nr:hypothetical protein GLYMA_10G293300v4 [Glycine max]
MLIFRWAAASNDISLNAMILPVALYFWKIPHFMALAYLCRDDFAAGGFKMYSLADASGHRISLVALGNSMYLIPLGFLAYDSTQRTFLVSLKCAKAKECSISWSKIVLLSWPFSYTDTGQNFPLLHFFH